MPVDTELYDLLGVPPTASEGDIKKAYRKKAKEHHPDKNPDDPNAAQKFQEMAAAYEILIDSQSRAAYDAQGMSGLGGSSDGGMPDPADMFAQFFGGGGGGAFFDFGPGAGMRPRKGQDTHIPYDVTLEDLYNGKSIKLNMEKEVVCNGCQGIGAKGSAKPKECAQCQGKGWTAIHTQLSPQRYGTARAKCTDCNGEGSKFREKDRCKKCKGAKTVKEKNRQEIFVEKGMVDGQKIVLSGAGDEEPGVPPGDVVFQLKMTHHESFERSGPDLMTNVKITLSEALLGFSRILITHLDGRGIHVANPPRKIIKPGHTIIIRGEGMPTYKNPDHRGNLYIVFDVEMPDATWMNAIDGKLLEQLLPPKKADLEPTPSVVDEVTFEEADIEDFGEGDEHDWEDDDYDDDDFPGAQPECRPQ